MSIETRVARGARFLDQTLPGWASMIDTSTINLQSSSQCILGQLNRRDHRLRAIQDKGSAGDFYQALRKIGFRFGQITAFMVAHGFMVRPRNTERGGEAWRKEIAQRLPKPERKPRPLYVKDHWSTMEEYLAEQARRSNSNYISV